MVHRGPDDQGVYVDPDCELSLAARRLSIIDVAGGHQPVSNEDASVWAVLNGEIYNHAALRDRLRGRGHTFASATDTEVLVHLYEDYGPALVHALEGMYAFAIWDCAARRLTIVRDRFGEKPLFYAECADRLLFASELTALRAGLGVDPELDPQALDAFLLFGYVPGERTIFQNARELHPASMLSWSPSAPHPQTTVYWSLPTRTASRRETLAELADEASHLLRQAVRSRLVADVPVGVFLSGGLDSNIVASIAATEVAGRLKTFTVSYDVGNVGEGDPARVTAERLGVDHHEVTLSSSELANSVPRLMGSLDQPNADPALIALHTVAGFARRQVTVAVGGEGADELFGGYPRYRWMNRAGAVDRHVPRTLALVGATLIRRAPRNEQVLRVADVVEPVSFSQRNLDWVTGGRRQSRFELYGPRLMEHANAQCGLNDELTARGTSDAPDPAASAMALDQRRYLPDDVLAKADRATMLVSLEMRTPYLSRELAEFSATIPSSVHLANGGKAVLREVATRLPGISDVHRAKRAFRVPMADWLRGPLAPLLEHQASDGSLVGEGWLDQLALQRMIGAHHRGAADHAGLLWPVLVAGLWLDHLRAA